MKVIKDLIDFQYEQFTISAFALQFKIFLTFYIIPLIVLVFTRNSLVVFGCVTSCTIITLIIFLFETIQMKFYGLQEYLKDPWNRVDLSMFFLNIFFFTQRAMQAEGQEMSTLTIALNMISIPFGFLKLMHFFRGVYESFGQLISLIVICLSDISIFMLFFTAWIIFFTIFYRIAEVDFGLGDYEEIEPNIALLLQTYRISIGDLAAPLYPRWILMVNSEDPLDHYIGLVMITIIWSMWILHQFILLILLLNFLIAIVSQSYENVMQKTEVFIYS